MFKAIYCLFMIAICSVYTLSQDINTSRLDSLFNILSEKNKAMGSVAISKNGKIIYRKTIGYSFIQDSIKKLSTDSTKYRVGSITKTFTATMIFQLIDEGNLLGQATGQPSFPLVAKGKDKFACDRFGLKLEFNTEKNEMILFQREKFLFRKSK
jgi:D-alanyl-D-alanine carboxypeptidase